MIYELMVKGSAEVAAEHARKRHFEVKEILKESNSTTTLLGEGTFDSLVSWFNTGREPPFPDGELIWYREVKP